MDFYLKMHLTGNRSCLLKVWAAGSAFGVGYERCQAFDPQWNAGIKGIPFM
jgi:hypothetical protein